MSIEIRSQINVFMEMILFSMTKITDGTSTLIPPGTTRYPPEEFNNIIIIIIMTSRAFFAVQISTIIVI